MAGANNVISAPSKGQGNSAERGLTEAIQSICQLTPKQQELFQNPNNSDIVNRGIIVLITSLQRLDEGVDGFVEKLEDVI